MKKALFASLVLLSLKSISQSNTGCFLIGGSDAEGANAIVVTYDGNYVVGGYQYPTTGFADMYLVKTEPSGNVLWSRTLGDIFVDNCKYLVETSDHSLIVVGESTTGNILVAKFDEDGNLLWSKDVDLLIDEVPEGVAESENNGFIITGYCNPPFSSRKAFLINFDSNGNKVWETVFVNLNNPFGFAAMGFSVVKTVENRYVLSGYSESSPNYYWVASFNENGNFLWAKQSESGPAYDIAATADSGVILAGYLCTTTCDALLSKFDREGNLEWSKAIGDSLFDAFFALETTDDGGVIAAGVANNAEFIPDYRSYGYIVKLHQDGDVEWSHILGDATHYREFRDVYQTDDGGYVAAGISWSNPTDMFIAKLDAEGNICDDCLSGDYGVEVSGDDFEDITMSPETDVSKVIPITLEESTGASITEICMEVGIESVNDNLSLTVSPNPSSSGIFKVITSEKMQDATIKVYDVRGRIITMKSLSATKNLIDLSDHADGIYFLFVVSNDHQYSAKLIK